LAFIKRCCVFFADLLKENYYGDVPLALPKLNLQFLSHYDYLLRNYTLFRLEAAYDLRFDIENVVSRMNPKLLSDGQVKFEGWARQVRRDQKDYQI
jgi:intron-binding protein aquarius